MALLPVLQYPHPALAAMITAAVTPDSITLKMLFFLRVVDIDPPDRQCLLIPFRYRLLLR